MDYFLHLLIYFDIYVILALSLNLVTGYCGLLTLAHASYFAIGAYSYGILSRVLDWEFVPAALVGSALAALLSVAISLPSWRLRRDFFVLATLAVQILFFSAFNNWFDPTAPLGSWENLTNGSFGIASIPKPAILGHRFESLIDYAMLATLIATASAHQIWRLKSSPWGRVVIAIRDDELVARGLAKQTRMVKVQALAFSCGFAALAGSLYGGYVSYVDPSSASLDQSILMLSMVLVGGAGNFVGPIIGAAVLVALPEVLRSTDLPSAQAAQLQLMIYGVLLVFFMRFRPSGLAGRYDLE